MRNLKKALSLALALVMMFGMLTFASAADEKVVLADLASVENKDAVTLLVDLGIIAGIVENGVTNFKPLDSIDRNSFAKLVYFILMGTTPEDSFKGGGTLKDVPGTWAEGFVNYLNSVQIVSGDNYQNFNGTDKVTVAQAAKMLLVALGYNALDRGYEADMNWSINIMKDAQSKGLMNNVGQTSTQELTRDNAAQMVFNALFATTVTPKFDRDMGEKYVSEYTNNVTTLGLEVYGLVKATLSIGAAGAGATDWTFSPAVANPPAITANAAKTAINNKYTFGPETVGGKAVIYVKVGYSLANGALDSYTYKSLISGTALVGADNVISTTYGDYTVKQLMNTKGNNAGTGKHGGFVAVPAATVAVYLNGATGTTLDTDANGAVKLEDADGATVALLAGDIVELVANNDGEISVIRITRKTVAKITAAPETKVVGDTTQVRVPGVIGSFGTSNTTANVFGYEGLKKDDIVLYVKIGDNTYIEKADSFEGRINDNNGKRSDTGITIGTDVYYASDLAGTTYVAHDFVDEAGLSYKVDYMLYLDNGGNVVATKQLSEDISSNYAFVLDTAWVGGTGIDASEYAQAKLLYTDGTTEIVTVAAANGDLDEDNWGKPTQSEKGKSYAVAYTFVNFSKASNGRFTLVELDNKIAGSALAGETFTKGTATIGSSVTANANTVFIIQTGSGSSLKYSVYTGYNNAPTFTVAAGASSAAGLKNTSGFATYIFAVATVQGAAGDYIYFGSASYGVDASGNRTYGTAYVNGVRTSVTLAASAIRPAAGEMYQVKARDADGKILTFETAELIDVAVAIDAVGGGVIRYDGGTTKNIDDDTNVFIIGTDRSVTESSISAITTEYKAVVILSSTSRVGTIYLIAQS